MKCQKSFASNYLGFTFWLWPNGCSYQNNQDAVPWTSLPSTTYYIDMNSGKQTCTFDVSHSKGLLGTLNMHLHYTSLYGIPKGLKKEGRGGRELHHSINPLGLLKSDFWFPDCIQCNTEQNLNGVILMELSTMIMTVALLGFGIELESIFLLSIGDFCPLVFRIIF